MARFTFLLATFVSLLGLGLSTPVRYYYPLPAAQGSGIVILPYSGTTAAGTFDASSGALAAAAADPYVGAGVAVAAGPGTNTAHAGASAGSAGAGATNY